MVIVLSLVTTAAFAAEGDGPMVVATADKSTIKPGETLTITYTLDHDLDYMTRLDLVLKYDATLFQFVSTDIEGSVWFNEPAQNGPLGSGTNATVRIRENNDDNEDTISAGKLCSITFTALDSIDSAQTASFYNGTTGIARSSIVVDEDTYRVSDGAFDHGADDPIQVTIAPDGATPIPTATGYSVSMGANQQAVGGQKVRIPVTVASSEKGITGFNAYDMTFTYDPAALTLNTTSDSAANLTVEDNNGTVRVRRYGNTVALGEALALDFTANKATSSTVTLTNAKFDIDANSINFDAPAAAITDADTAVKALWTVTLPDGFLSTAANASTLVEDGGDFTFKATDTHYEYYLNITTNGATSIKKMDKATYTIKNVTDNVTVTVDNKIGKTYTIKFVVVDSTTTVEEDKATVDDLVAYSTTTVQYPNDYQFTVKFPGTGFKTLVSFTPDKNTSQSERQENGDCKYTLLGDTLTGDENNEITVTVKKVKNDALKNIIVEGNGADAFDATNEKNFYAGENYTYKLNLSEQYYDYTIGVWYFKPLGNGRYDIKFLTPKQNDDGSYTIVDMPAYDVTIRITKTPKAVDPNAVDVSKYLELNDKTVYIVTVYGNTTITSGGVITQQNGYTYDGALMYNTFYYKDVNGNAGHSYLIIVNQNETLDKETVVAKLAFKENLNSDEIKSINMSGAVAGSMNSDVNGSGKTDVNDLQLIYDLYNGVYDSFNQASMKKFLLADRTKDRQLDSQDAVQLAQGGYFN